MLYASRIMRMSLPVAAEIFGKMRAMEHLRFTALITDMAWLLVSFGEPLVTFLTALFECWSDYRKEVSLLGAVIIHHSAYLLATMGRVECFILLLSGLRG